MSPAASGRGSRDTEHPRQTGSGTASRAEATTAWDNGAATGPANLPVGASEVRSGPALPASPSNTSPQPADSRNRLYHVRAEGFEPAFWRRGTRPRLFGSTPPSAFS